MKVEMEITEGVVISTTTGKAAPTRMAHVRWQSRPRAPWKKANIIVETDDVPTLLEAAAAYIRLQK